MSPEAYALASTDWQVFATLTFKRAEMRQADRSSMLFAWLRDVAKAFGVHFHRLKWAVRPEAGELTGRFHYHALIAGCGVGLGTEQGCKSLMALWEGHGGGIARCRTWDGRDAVAYILKDSGTDHSTAGANAYELRKFRPQHWDPILSKSLLRIRRGKGREGRREGRSAPRTKG